MAEIKLNKPLYKTDDEADFTPPIPRKPQSHLLGRGAALFLDIMLLHLIFAAVVRFVPEVSLALGWAAPWLGLALGFLYFGFGFSHITLGRTMGKLITRVQVADIAGPDLPLGRAFARAGLLLWPLPVQLVLRMIAENAANQDPTNIYATLEVFGTMLILGWVLGNALFAASDPFKRTVYDRLVNSIVINAELEAEPTAAYLADARQANQQPPLKRSITGLGLALTLTMAFATASAMSAMTELRDLPEDQRERARAMVIPGYGRAMPAQPLSDPATTHTVAVAVHLRKRTPIDMDALKANPETSATLDRIISNIVSEEYIEGLHKYASAVNLERGKRGELPMQAPSKIHFELSYAEYADLFFARESHPVYTLSRVFDIPTTATVSADDLTTR